jgi:hypothetical protein
LPAAIIIKHHELFDNCPGLENRFLQRVMKPSCASGSQRRLETRD